MLHAIGQITQLSSKTANRIYHSVAAQLSTIKKEDVTEYIQSVISILHLTHFIAGGEKEAITSPSSEKPSSPTSEKPQQKH